MLEKIKGKLIISCQALPGEPLYGIRAMGKMALAAKMAGAAGIRAQGVSDILDIKKEVDLPIIGIIKRNYADSDIYITPTKKEIDELLTTGCEMIALDATERIRPNGEKLKDLIDYIHQHQVLVMADCSTFEEALNAQILGADVVSSTLAGYTPYSKKINGPDYELISKMVKELEIPVIAEGKIHYPEQLKNIMALGVFSAVVGGAITRPLEIAKRFIEVL